MTTRIRVLCVDDHRLVRDGLALIIGREPDMEVVGCPASGAEAVEYFSRQAPDVTVMDLQMHPMSGVQAIQIIRGMAQSAKIIALTMYQGDEDIYRALEAGAAGYLLKDALSDDLVQMIRDLHADRVALLSSDLTLRLNERQSKGTLTPREVRVIELAFTGMRNKEIAATLGISEETVQVHMKNVLTRLNAKNRSAAINIALRRGIIHVS